MTAPALQAIDAETQIFTPEWVGKFLAQNSIGRLWVNSHPHSRMFDAMGRYVACGNPSRLAKVDSPMEIRVLDPACGTGNLLIVAFDLLYDIYIDAGYRASEIPAAILTNNLFGYDIDAAAAAAARARLIAKAHEKDSHFFRRSVSPNVRAWSDSDHPSAGLLGSLIRELDDTQYHVVLANPPYMGGKHFNAEMKAFARANYPATKADLCAMFIERGHEMTMPGGMIAMITMESWMVLKSFEEMRAKQREAVTTITMAHLGRGVFGSGAVISTTAFVQASLPDDGRPGVYFRLVDSRAKARDLQLGILNYRMERQGLDPTLLFGGGQEPNDG